MVQLRFLSGPKAGGFQAVRRFPFRVGRSVDNDLCVDAAGIWDYHFVLDLRRDEGVILQTCDQALSAVNDEPQASARLRNGDIISFGSAKVQFWLSSPTQRGLRLREWSVWGLLILITAGQLVVIGWLMRQG